jgi:transposase
MAEQLSPRGDLALITMFQFIEELPDRQAADAIRGRIDWQYLLGLELADPGFDASLLCKFRKRNEQTHGRGRSYAFCSRTSLPLWHQSGF